MHSTVAEHINQLLLESTNFNANDVLINSCAENKKLMLKTGALQYPEVDIKKQVLLEAKRSIKESGINPLCITEGIVEHQFKGNEVATPIFITPLEFTSDRIKKVVKFEPIEDEKIVNPFLKKYLSETLGTAIPDGLVSLESWLEFLNSKGLNAHEGDCFIGNYHPHRFQVIRELEDLLSTSVESQSINSIFGVSGETKDEFLELSKKTLFPADTDHEMAFHAVSEGHTVIQGPPGTGKSQVLANLLGKLLIGSKAALVLSEKRPALEVVEKRLASHGLNKLCFIASGDKVSSTFLDDLQKTWNYFEASDLKPEPNIMLSEQLEDNLQLLIDLLRKDDLIGGISLYDFKTRFERMKSKEYNYSSEVCSIKHYDEIEAKIRAIYTNKISGSIGRLKPHLFIEDQRVDSLDQKLDQWEKELKGLSTNKPISTFSELENLIQLAAVCQIYQNDLYKKHASIFKPNSRAQKRFLKLRKEWKKSTINESQFSENGHWFRPISLVETSNIEELVNRSGWFSQSKAKRKWKTYSSLDYSGAQKAIAERKKHLELKAHISQLLVDFCELGIESPEESIDLIYQSLGHYTEEKWDVYSNLDSESKIALTNQHQQLNSIWREIKTTLEISGDEDLFDVLKMLRNDLKSIVDLKSEITNFEATVFKMLRRNSSQSNLEGELYASHWTLFCQQFPSFAEFNIEAIRAKVDEIITAQQHEESLLARTIEFETQAKFRRYHEILNTPARKLSEPEKTLKKRLRKGKSILVKEFGKTRSHLSLRELFHSEASEWIRLLKPIWMSNPTQLTKCFPMDRGMFDVCIFDEASQIPLQNSLGAIYRSDRVVVAGDEQQMGPTSYFTTGSTEQIDLLHQASFYWNKTPLKHHYRSSHPELISFSNKHFYNNELMAYPTYNCERPLHLRFVENGQFIDRKNIEEAKIVASIIEEALKSTDEIGVVAFSEEQLSCIWEELSVSAKKKLTKRLDDNKGFLKAVENVQGDECDRLIISFGYAKDTEGEFHHRFGPMNTSNGRKRLNVLLTRSRKRIDFITSVKSSDFKLTDNESINLIKQWFIHIESFQSNNNNRFPLGLKTSIENDALTLTAVHKKLHTARELVTTQSILQSRGWKIHYN